MNRCAAAVLLLLVCLPVHAEDGGEKFESVPAWVVDPPAREGWIRAVDVGLSNLLRLAYSPERVHRDRLNLRWRIERALRPLLGEEASRPALAGAEAATIVRQGHHLKRARRSRTVGGQVYSVFALWETPLATVLEAVPPERRDEAAEALRAPIPKPSWPEVTETPAWVATPTAKDGKFVAAAEEISSRADVARAVADLRGAAHVRWEIQARLRFHVGNALAFEAANRAASYCEVLERAWQAEPATAWMLWSIPIDRILDGVPAASRDAAREALGEPIPPRASAWQAVDREPDWVKRPPRWPDHMPYVQAVTSEHADVARQQSIREAEGEIREDLESLLQPVLGFEAAARAANAGARSRAQGAHAIHERRAGSGTARAEGTRLVDAWTLWQIPVEKVLKAVDPEHHASVRKALLP